MSDMKQIDEQQLQLTTEQPQKPSPQMNEELFIDLVRGYEFLYDPHKKEYRNQRARMMAWNEIAENFVGVSGNECKEMWTRLRNAYTNALKRRKKKPGQAAKNIPKWKFEDQMSFLILSLDQRLTDGNLDSDEYEDEILTAGGTVDNTIRDPNGDAAYTPCANDSANSLLTSTNGSASVNSSHNNAFVPMSPSTPPSSYQNQVQRNTMKRRIESSTGKMIKKHSRVRSHHRLISSISTHQNYACDDTEMFFLSMARNVKKLNGDEQARVKMEVSKVVFEAELKHFQRYDSSSSNFPAHSDSPNERSYSSSDSVTPNTFIVTEEFPVTVSEKDEPDLYYNV